MISIMAIDVVRSDAQDVGNQKNNLGSVVMLMQKSHIFRTIVLCLTVVLAASAGWTFAQEHAGASSGESPDVRFIRAWVELAEANLEKARANGAPSYITVVYEQAVLSFSTAQERMNAGQPLSSYQGFVATLERLSKIAENRWRTAKSLHDSDPDSISDYELRILKSKFEILGAGAEKGRGLSNAESHEQIEWQLEQHQSLILLMADRLFRDGL